MNTLQNALTLAFDQFEENYSKRFTDYIEEHYKDVTVDINGRLHAPYDGYTVNAKHYRKGEFIDMEINDGDLPVKDYFKGKIKILVKDFDIIKEIIEKRSYGYCKKGQSWTDTNGNEICYLYLEVFFKSHISIVEDAVKNSIPETKIVFVEEGKHSIVAKLIKIETKFYQITNNLANTSFVGVFVTEAGAIVRGTLAKAIENAEIGDLVEFTATFENKTSCSVFKRPSKARIIS